MAEALTNGEELEDDELGALVDEDKLKEATLDDGLLGAALELDDGIGGAELDDGAAGFADEDAGAAGGEGGDDEPLEDSAVPDELAPELLPSKTTKLALLPLGTVTTQKLAPPTPIVPPAEISLTLCVEGSMAHGRPLHPPPSQMISTPQVGIWFLNGVAGSR